MGIVLTEYDLSIMLVPKGASTTIKHIACEIEYGAPFKPELFDSRPQHIHELYPTEPFAKQGATVDWGKDVFAVVRDPVERIISCHSNRVKHHNELKDLPLTDEDKEKGVVDRPNFEVFIEHFERYQELSASIKHHSLPMHVYLGELADIYTRIFDVADLTEFWEDIQQRVGDLPKVEQLQTGGKQAKARQISKATVDKIQRVFAKDYDTYGAFLVGKAPTYTVV